MEKRFARPLAGLLAFSVCLSSLALPALAEGPELSSDEGDAEYSITLYIEEGEDEPEQTGSGDASSTEEDETDAGAAGGTVETVSSTEEETVTDPETGAVTTTTTTKTEWSGTDEDGLDVEGEGTRTETVTTGTETTDGPQPGQTTTTTTTDTEWKEEAGQTGTGETDSPDPGTTIETETKTEVTGSESRTDSVTTDAQDRVVEESGSYEGSETTTTETTDERTHTEYKPPVESEPIDKEPTSETTTKNTTVKPGSVDINFERPEVLDTDEYGYNETEMTMTPGQNVTTPLSDVTENYEPPIAEGTVTKGDGTKVVTQKKVDDEGHTTGYTVTTTTPDGKKETETVTYIRDEKNNVIRYNSTKNGTTDVPLEDVTEDYEPTIQTGIKREKDEEGNVTATVITKMTTDKDGNNTGYTVTTFYSDGTKEIETVTYERDKENNVTGYTSKKEKTTAITVDYEPTIDQRTEEKKDEDGNVTEIVTTKETLGEDGKTSGYTVTTTYPNDPNKTVTETVTYNRDKNGNYIGYISTTVTSTQRKPTTSETSEDVSSESKTVLDDERPEPEEKEVTIILVPDKPAESETTDAVGNTTKVTVEELYNDDGVVIGYQVKTTVTDADGKQVSTASESVWGTRTTVTTKTVTNYTTTTTKTEQVTTTTVEAFDQAVTVSGVRIFAKPGELKVGISAVTGDIEVDPKTLTTLKPLVENAPSGKTDTTTDLYNRKDKDGGCEYVDTVGGFQWLGEYGIESAIRVEAPGKNGGAVYTWQPHQFVLEDGTGKKYYVYCTDFDVGPNANMQYDVLPLEESGYYNQNTTVSDHEDHVRAIALNGYWGTDEGTGSMEAFREMLSKAKGENGEPLFTEEEIASITPGMAVTATQAAIWYYGNSGTQLLDAKDIVGHYYDPDGELVQGYDPGFGPVDDEDLVNAMYQYLITLEEKPATNNTLIKKDDFAQEVKIKVNGKVGADTQNTPNSGSEQEKYDVDLTFTMGLDVVAADEKGNELMVKVIQINEDGSTTVLAEEKLNGNGSNLKYDSENNSYTFSGLALASGAQLELQLDGTQNLQEGVYLFRARAGYDQSQTFVGVGNVEQTVDLKVNLEFNVTEPAAIKTEASVSYDQVHEIKTIEEFERLTTVTVKSAEITVTEQTTDEQHRKWEGEYHHTYTYDEPEKPETPAEVEEISVKTEIPAAPQATLPQTGQNWAMVGLLTFAGVLLAGAGVLTGKRREDEHEA